MLLLITHGHPTIVRFDDPHLGRLVQPRHYSSIEETARSGTPWAADNDAYNGGFDEDAYRQMLERLHGLPGCVFVAAPDVVGDAEVTYRLWEEWGWALARYELPPAYVLQDGLEDWPVPWGQGVRAVFIGGTTEFKLGEVAREVAAEAKRRGLWVHMGRVNSLRRIRYANAIGCDSVDGSKYARWTDTRLPLGLAAIKAGPQLFLEEEGAA
jgi:hypothetical protein